MKKQGAQASIVSYVHNDIGIGALSEEEDESPQDIVPVIHVSRFYALINDMHEGMAVTITPINEKSLHLTSVTIMPLFSTKSMVFNGLFS